MTVEGEKDDITGVGQTEAAQTSCRGLPAERRRHFVAQGVGHYGVFNGSRWRKPDPAAGPRLHPGAARAGLSRPRGPTRSASATRPSRSACGGTPRRGGWCCGWRRRGGADADPAARGAAGQRPAFLTDHEGWLRRHIAALRRGARSATARCCRSATARSTVRMRPRPAIGARGACCRCPGPPARRRRGWRPGCARRRGGPASPASSATPRRSGVRPGRISLARSAVALGVLQPRAAT